MQNNTNNGNNSSNNNGNNKVNSSRNSGTGGVDYQYFFVELVSMAVSYGLLFLGVRYIMREMDPMRKQKKEAKKSHQKLMQKLIANGREPFEMNEYENIISGDLIYPEDLEVNFDMIGGLEHVKQEVFDLVALPLQRPDLFQGQSALLRPPKGILLYGPPGTGKTMLAKAIARESGAAFISLQMSTTMNKWFGESQKLVRATFSLAWKLAPCIIFIDEIDSFLRERTSDDHAAQGNMKAEFMALWDGLATNDMATPSHGYGVIVIGATNRPWDVDQAILRRMPRTFKLGLPNIKQRESILRIFLRGETLDPVLTRSMTQLSQMLEGYSGSDIKELCQAAAMIPFREFAQNYRECGGDPNNIKTQKMRPLKIEDFMTARRDVKATGQAAYEYQGETQAPNQNEILQNLLNATMKHARQNAANGSNQDPNGEEFIADVE